MKQFLTFNNIINIIKAVFGIWLIVYGLIAEAEVISELKNYDGIFYHNPPPATDYWHVLIGMSTLAGAILLATCRFTTNTLQE